MELPDQGLFLIPEAAVVLGVPKRTLYRKIESGEIPAEHVIRNLGFVRITRAYLCTLLGIEDLNPIRHHAEPAEVAS